MNILSKLYKIIIFYDKLFFYIIISLLFIASIFEAIGVSLIIPLISIIILDESSLNHLSSFKFLTLNKMSKNELLIYFSLIFFLFFVFKTLYLLCTSFLQEKFTYGLINKLSLMLYNNYLNQPMIYHIEQNSSSIIKNIMIELKNLQILMLTPFIVLISETLLLFSLSIVLIYVDHKAFILISLTLLGFFFVYYILVKNKIKHWGAKRIKADDLKIKNVQETFTSIKEIKIYRAEKFFLEKFKEFNFQSSIYGRLQSWFENIPKLMIDLAAIVALLFFIFFTFKFNNGLDLFITKVGLFGFAFFRMLPAINRILIASQNFRFAIPFFDNIYKEFKNSQKNNISKKVKYLNDKLESIKFSNVEFSYSNNKVLENINLSINKGMPIGIIGKSGSGKTTLVNLSLGLITPTNGNIYFNNKEKDLSVFLPKIGYVTQNINLINDTVIKNIAYGIDEKKIDYKKVQSLLIDLDLKNFINELDKNISNLIGEKGSKLSGGQLQRIAIARALYFEPEILILDEATSSLDDETEKKILQLIKKYISQSLTIIISHKKDTLKYCSTIYKLEDNHLIKI